MHKLSTHPIIPIPEERLTKFNFEGVEVKGEKGFTIAAALHQAGFPVHTYSLEKRSRSLECGIGKCGACEMLVDGVVRRVCITYCDNVKQVKRIPREYVPEKSIYVKKEGVKIYKTEVVIIGAGPAGLAAREVLNEHNVSNIVVDNNSQIGGQFNMQTHQFFFFEKEKKYGGMRGFEIAKTLAGDDHSGIMLNCTVWDVFEGNRVAVKDIRSDEVFYIDCSHFVVASGAIPFMPSFKNDDLPGVYTAAVVQKMMNIELTLLGQNVLTVGAGNIGYLTSYQLTQAGAKVKAIIEAMPNEGGFPVQANRVRRLGIPVMLSHMILEALPNKSGNGIRGALIAEAENFKPISGTEKIIDNIDVINICTGLVPDDSLLIKGREMFGRNCYGAGDAIRIGEGTSAVLRGKQVAYEILENIQKKYNYDDYLTLSKDYIDSQQHPVKILDKPILPGKDRLEKPFVIVDCLHGFACNPCVFACRYGAITKSSTSTAVEIDHDKCVGCMECVYQCPGLAIFGYNIKNNIFFLPVEFDVEENKDVFLVDNNANVIGDGVIQKVLRKKNLTHVVRIKADNITEDDKFNVRGFIIKEEYPEKLELKKQNNKQESQVYMCHCEDIRMDEVLRLIGDRKFISVEEIKHNTHMGMGSCRGTRCIKRLQLELKALGIQLTGTSTPRAPLANQLLLGELYPAMKREKVLTDTAKNTRKVFETKAFVAGGGIGGSSLFRFLAEEGYNPVMTNYGFGSSWRNIAGGRSTFSLPELTEIARYNLELFEQLQQYKNIDFRRINYITFAHDEETFNTLEESMKWQNAKMVFPDEFQKEISPFFNRDNKNYIAALKAEDCWQSTPGKVIESLRQIGLENGGSLLENTELIDVDKVNDIYRIILKTREGEYIEYHTPVFINALGDKGEKFARMLGIETGLFSVKHQAFITRRLPMLGLDGQPLNMVIDRRKYKGFTAVYGQQLGDTGQVIGCASPFVEPTETDKDLKINSKDFAEIVSEIFVDWIPQLSSVGFQALWAGYYIEPRMIIDTEKGLFLGLRGQGYMLGQYLAKLYVDQLSGKEVPDYFNRLSLEGDALLETAFK